MEKLNLTTEITDHDGSFQSFSRCSEQIEELCRCVASAESRMQRLVEMFSSSGASFINNNYYSYSSGVPLPPTPLPTAFDYMAVLNSVPALRIKQALMEHGLIDDCWQCTHLSGAEISLLAKAICDRLNIKDVWQVFGQLWNRNPATLRSYFNKALEQKKSLDFQDRLLKILGPISIR